MTLPMTLDLIEVPERPAAVHARPFDPRRVGISAIGTPRLLRGVPGATPVSFATHVGQHGDVPVLDQAQLLGALDAVGLTGRGGAAFPLAAKVRALRAGERVVVVNGAEGEPASAKDAVLLGLVPHLVLDGAAVTARAIHAGRVIVVVTDPAVELLVRAAIGRRPDATLFELRRLPDRFIAGEARTVVRVLNGGPPLPPGRRIHATDQGVAGQPTLLANAETFAHVALLARPTPAGTSPAGTSPAGTPPVGEAETGTVLLSVTGAVARPGVVEVLLGTKLGELAAHVGALPSPVVVIGGYHGAWVPCDPAIALSRAGLRAVGGTLGAGVVVFVGDDTCAVSELGRIADWLAAQSARQCGPCAFALPALAEEIRTLRMSEHAAAVTARHLRQLPGRGACSHPDGSARFLSTGLARCAQDLASHRRHDRCGRTDRGYLSTNRAAAFALGGRP